MSAQDKSKKKRLGEYLIDSGLVTKDQVSKALEEQKKAGARLGQTLIELGLISEEELIVALAKQLDIAHIDVASYVLKQDVVKLIPESVARQYELIILEKVGNNLTVAMSDPLNVFAIDEVQKLTQCKVEPVICLRSSLFKALDLIYKKSGVAKSAQGYPEQETGAGVRTEGAKEAVFISDGHEVIELVEETIAAAVKERATDIHIEPDENCVRVRCRIDGFLREFKTYPHELLPSVVSRIKVLSGLDISEKRVPQDGRFQFELEKHRIDLRVSTLPTVLGEKVVMRILDKALVMMELGKLGFSKDDLAGLNSLIKRPYGMMLVTGPTSSGKTTTLYSALQEINTVEKNILTVEDPVEYRLKMINQVQVNPKAGLTFAAGLRSFLRQDPNVIMIGEIRDKETAEIAVQSALTGHLVFSTVHTNDAPSTITRLVDMGVESFLVASAVTGILAQRLIRTICHNCKEEFVPVEDSLKNLFLDQDRAHITFYRGKGCENCRGTGYQGRIGIYELMVINDRIRELILKNAPTVALRSEAKTNGMHTLREDGLEKVTLGLTTIEEVLRATTDESRG
ncbi:MAG: Flp pilus assembly complex ATPase component TadA [Candidatus Omnitrophica bacterium]|nr:Flp pilus assembly complex ATPase component TadA [Candidatus Omnitrophota bacterium]MBU1924680.1 Flp pilus assembly complex ATPase component TadA [Candidatus Omnitrophota bacterium]